MGKVIVHIQRGSDFPEDIAILSTPKLIGALMAVPDAFGSEAKPLHHKISWTKTMIQGFWDLLR